MKIWTASKSEYEITRDRSGFTVKKIGGKVNSPSGSAIGDVFHGDEFVVEKGSPAVLKKAGKIVITISTVTAIFK